MSIDWSKQHCGVHQATYDKVLELMPDLKEILDTFPDSHNDFTWDIKVHMLFPNQYACMPSWHYDYIPRINGIQRFDLCKLHLPMYIWISNPPLTSFKEGFLLPKVWHRFNQSDVHKGNPADDFIWRGFIRAIHKEILPPKESDWLRRHTQVYTSLDYQW